MTALKAFRADLADHLADGLSIPAAPLGAQTNPPVIVVRSGSSYVTAPDYCLDAIFLDVVLIAPPGDLSAVADELDDLVDLVRPVLKTASPGGHRYRFVEVSGHTTYPVGEKDMPAVVVTVQTERQAL